MEISQPERYLVPGAFKVDHLLSVMPILFWYFSNFWLSYPTAQPTFLLPPRAETRERGPRAESFPRCYCPNTICWCVVQVLRQEEYVCYPINQDNGSDGIAIRIYWQSYPQVLLPHSPIIAMLSKDLQVTGIENHEEQKRFAEKTGGNVITS